MAKGIYIRTKEHNEKISKAHKAFGDNHWMKRPESREKLRKANLGKPGYWAGKKRDDPAYLEKLSLAHKGQHSSPDTEFKKVPGTVRQRSEYWRKYREKNKERLKLWHRQYMAKNREKISANKRKKKHGIDGSALFESQKGLCAGCKVDLLSLSPRNRHLDHNHETGFVRGWLCHWCNVIEGLANGSSEKLRLIADYIDSFKKK